MEHIWNDLFNCKRAISAERSGHAQGAILHHRVSQLNELLGAGLKSISPFLLYNSTIIIGLAGLKSYSAANSFRGFQQSCF